MSLGAWGDEGNVGDALNDGYCADCGEAFHLDDCGGYNPPCNCGKCDGTLCRACCRTVATEDVDADWEDDEVDAGWARNPDASDSLWDSDPTQGESNG